MSMNENIVTHNMGMSHGHDVEQKKSVHIQKCSLCDSIPIENTEISKVIYGAESQHG